MNGMEHDEFSWWRDAVDAGRPVETEVGNVRSGYYRIKNEAIAFYRSFNDLLYPAFQVVCWRSGTEWPAPTKPDEIEDLFSFCAPHPVSYDDFCFFQENNRWPDQILLPEKSGNPSLTAAEGLSHEIEALREQAEAWLAGVGKIASQADADKGANYGDEFAKLEKRGVESHKVNKAPHLEAGRQVDATYKPLIERAANLKTWAKKTYEPFLIAEKARLAAEEKARRAELDRIEKEAAEARVHAARIGAPPPPEPERPFLAPPPKKAGAGTQGRRTGVKTRRVALIVDLPAYLRHLATLNHHPDYFIETMLKRARMMLDAGEVPPGIEDKIEEYV